MSESRNERQGRKKRFDTRPTQGVIVSYSPGSSFVTFFNLWRCRSNDAAKNEGAGG